MADTVLVTGVAGFIGFHLANRLLRDGYAVVGIDNLNDYYDVRLKQGRLEILAAHNKFVFHRLDLCDREGLQQVFRTHAPKYVLNLAAQAGVRYSLSNPDLYVKSNIVGFLNLLEMCRFSGIDHLVYASSSSVYGANPGLPYIESEKTDHPVSLYGATKKSNELMAYAYSHLFGFPSTGLRFFTVYGSWYRPDMAMFKFTKAILAGNPIDLYNRGEMKRDFTYVDDIIEGVVRIMKYRARLSPSSNAERHRIYNIGNHSPVCLLDFVRLLELILERKAQLNLLPPQDGEVLSTYADISQLQRDVGFAPNTPLEVGVPKFVRWYREYYKV